MSYRGIIIFIAGLAACFGSSLGETNGAPPAIPEILDGILCRSKRLSSGRINYHQTTGFVHLNKISDGGSRRFAFSGSSWSLRYDGGGTTISHNGKSVMHWINGVRANGVVDRAARIAAPKRLDENFPFPPYFAGTVWYEKTRKWIESNRDKARLAKAAQVNGEPTRVVEWDVPGEQRYQAFHSIPDTLRNGGVLRLYVAPHLCFALPRIEYVTPGGVVTTRFDSRDFQEVADGVFLPKRCERQLLKGRRPAHFVRYRILSMKSINRSIPDEEFVVHLPIGTVVSDERDVGPNKGAKVFTIREKGPFPVKDVDDVITTPWSPRPRRIRLESS